MKDQQNTLELPKEWKWVRLEEVCTKIGDIDHKMPKQLPTGYPYVSTKDFTYDLKISFANAKYISKQDYINLSRKIKPEKGDIIFPRYGTIGKNVLVDFDKEFLVSYSCAVIKPNHRLVLSKYVYLYSLSPKINKEIQKYIVETTQANVGIASIKSFVFPLPSLEIQQSIVSKIEELFSELDKGIENLRLAQQQLKTYRQSVLKWAFEGRLTEEWRNEKKLLPSGEDLLRQIQKEKEQLSNVSGKKVKFLTTITNEERRNLPSLPNKWLWVKLGDHAFVTKLAGFEFTKYVKYNEAGEIPVIRAQNVSKTSFIPRNFLYVAKDIMEKLPRSRVYGGEILMVFVGAGLGNVGIVPEKTQYFLGPNVAKIALEKQYNNKFIFHFLTSQLGFANVTGMSKATAQGSISMGNIREVSVPLISWEEQVLIVQEIETRLNVADKMEESLNQRLEQAEALRQSILKKAFEGKLL